MFRYLQVTQYIHISSHYPLSTIHDANAIANFSTMSGESVSLMIDAYNNKECSSYNEAHHDLPTPQEPCEQIAAILLHVRQLVAVVVKIADLFLMLPWILGSALVL